MCDGLYCTLLSEQGKETGVIGSRRNEIISILIKIINTLCHCECSKSLPTCVKANRAREKPTKKALLLEIFT